MRNLFCIVFFLLILQKSVIHYHFFLSQAAANSILFASCLFPRVVTDVDNSQDSASGVFTGINMQNTKSRRQLKNLNLKVHNFFTLFKIIQDEMKILFSINAESLLYSVLSSNLSKVSNPFNNELVPHKERPEDKCLSPTLFTFHQDLHLYDLNNAP